jgi:putative ABC transport system permease protein
MLPINAKLAIRQLQKNRTFTALNILGLTLGLTTFLLIVLYINDELSFDRFNVKAARIFRVNTDIKANDKITYFADAAPPVAPTLLKHYPEVERAVRMLPVQGGMRIKKGLGEIQEDRLVVCDPEIFDVFTLPMIEGDPATALQRPHSVVITESTAKKYFNSTHVVGRTLTDIDDTILLTVTGVIRDLPAQSSFHYDLFLTMCGNGMATDPNFYSFFPMSTFILLKPGANAGMLRNKLHSFMYDWGPDYRDYDTSGYFVHINLIALTDIHLHSNRTDELGNNGNSQYVYIFSAIALFVLLIAAINFMNLSTARSANRAREVGVRKVLGSPRLTLSLQFLMESLLVTLAATILALGLAILVMPWFNILADKSLSLGGHMLVKMLPFIGLIILVVGLMAGAYPAFFLSAFRPVDVLKGALSLGGKGSALRSTLVVFQFTVSLFLIAGTLIVYRQLHYIQNTDLGFSRGRVLVIKGMNALADPVTLEKEVRGLAGVSDATLSGFLPTNDKRWHDSGGEKSTQKGGWCQLWKVDEHYLPTLDMQLAAGRNFSPAFATDSNSMIINEAAAKMFGVAKDPLNKDISVGWYHGPKTFRTIGVVKDFHFSSLRDNIEPLAMVMYRDDDANLLIVRASTDNYPALLARLKDRWTALAPYRSFDYSFMDADFDALYRAEQRMGQLSVLFSMLAIVIACLGLFGLAAFAAEQRARELGIRKVLGASVRSILVLLSRDFARLIIIAVFIASPLAWWVMHGWLQNFAYRTTMPLWIFAVAAALVFCVALLTTLAQSRKAAVTNPVEVLRGE